MSKLKVEKNKENVWKSASVSLPEDKPIVLVDNRPKKGNIGNVLINSIEYDDRKMSVKLHGISLADKEPYKVGIDTVFQNENIEFTSNKDAKIIAKTLGQLEGLIEVNKKINKIASDRRNAALSAIERYVDDISNATMDRKFTEIYTKAYDKIMSKYEKESEMFVEDEVSIPEEDFYLDNDEDDLEKEDIEDLEEDEEDLEY